MQSFGDELFFAVVLPFLQQLLFDVLRLSKGLNIIRAKVMTLGDDVIDTFYLVGDDGNPIEAGETIAELRQRLMEIVLNPPPQSNL